MKEGYKESYDFRGVFIQGQIWCTKKLTLIEKCFLTQIINLDNHKECYASNNYLSRFFGVSISRCSQIISGLKEKGFINIQFIMKGKEFIKRIIIVNKNKIEGLEKEFTEYKERIKSKFTKNEIEKHNKTPIQFTKGGIKYSKEGIKENKRGSLENAKYNIINNNKINNKYTSKEVYSDSKESQELQDKSSYKNKKELSYDRNKNICLRKENIEILQKMKNSAGFSTRLPGQTKNKPTKTIIRTCSYIDKLIKNTFYDHLKDNDFFNNEHLGQYNITEIEVRNKLKTICNYEDLEKLLEKTTSYLKQEIEDAKQNKFDKKAKFLSKLSLERYFYDDNPKSYIKSYFIYYLFNKPKDNIDVINTKRIKQSLNKETIELAEKIKSKINEEVNEYSFWNNIKSIKKWLGSNREILLYKNELQDTDCNFEIEFGTIERILKKFIEFIQNQNIQTLKVSNIGAKNRTWNNWFIPEVMKIYNLQLTITDKDMKEYDKYINRKEEKREVIPFEDIPNELFENAIKRNEERRKRIII